MTNDPNSPGWADLLTLAAEVSAEQGPGSAGWQADGSQTAAINARVMQALRAHGGTLPGELGSVPCLVLTTIGARSGEARAVPLFYLEIDGHLCLIGSMGGAHRNPPWFHNLVKNPAVTVEKGGETFAATAVVTAGATRDYYFARFCATYPIFADYQAGTARVIPIVELLRQ